MADATRLPASQLTVEIGDGGSPEGFDNPCGITTRGFSRTANTNQTPVPDCDDQDAAPWLITDVVSKQWSITGAGILSEEYKAAWEAFFGQRRNILVTVGGQTYLCEGILTQYDVRADNGGSVTIDVTITGSGEPVLQT